MTTSHTTSNLFKPEERSRIPSSTLAYFRSRNRRRQFSVVHTELRKSGITRAVLAERLGKGIDQISHWLSAPANWTCDTFSDLIFAIRGGEPEYRVAYPLDKRTAIKTTVTDRETTGIPAGFILFNRIDSPPINVLEEIFQPSGSPISEIADSGPLSPYNVMPQRGIDQWQMALQSSR